MPGLTALGAGQHDLSPFSPDEGQRSTLRTLGYALAAERPGRLTHTHPTGLDVTLLSHDHGAPFDQQFLWAHLRGSAEACLTHRKM